MFKDFRIEGNGFSRQAFIDFLLKFSLQFYLEFSWLFWFEWWVFDLVCREDLYDAHSSLEGIGTDR